jgi:hypothetical protein
MGGGLCLISAAKLNFEKFRYFARERFCISIGAKNMFRLTPTILRTGGPTYRKSVSFAISLGIVD